MDASTINASTFTVSGGASGIVSGTVAYNGSTNTATFTPSAALASATAYTATITTGAADASGNGLTANFAWTFTTAQTSSTSSGGHGGCFIATAAYGSYLDPHVQVLRDFRDKYLMTNRPGRYLVRCYYRCSPPIAHVIEGSRVLRALVRWMLTPLVYGLKRPTTALFILLLSGAIIFRKADESGPRP